MCVTSVSITSSVRTYGSQFLQLRHQRWRLQNVTLRVCRLHSLCPRLRTSTVHGTCTQHSPLSSAVGVGCVRAGITPLRLTCLSSAVRRFSDNERGTNDEKGNEALKGFVFRVPNPVMWLKNKWYTYRVQSLVDPSFNLREFLVGAKQVNTLVCVTNIVHDSPIKNKTLSLLISFVSVNILLLI